MENLFPVLTVVVLLIMGFGFGKFLERRHYASIQARESALTHIPAVTFKELDSCRPMASAQLVVGSVVVSVDYFKRFLTGIRKIFGGELGAYATLIDRGRREAVLRMKESASDADLFLNCRLETSSISKGQKNRIGSVEVLAYATAIKFADEIRPETTEADG